MNSFKASIDAFFLHRRHFSFGNFGVTAFVNKGRQFRIIFRRFLRQRMTRSYRQVGTTHKGVRAGSVNGQRVVIVDNLFVRQYGLVVRAPVDRRSLLIYQAFFIQLGEEFLFPTVVFRRTGCQLAAPVITKAQHFELVFHIRDVVVRPRCRSGVVFHRRAFRRQTKRVPADRLQDVFAQHTLVAGDHVTDGVVTYVAHV